MVGEALYADLHIHTYYSDGSQSPREVVEAAKAAGLDIISICDHDLIDAYAELPGLCAQEGIQLIQGAELDVWWEGLRLHLLAYRFDPNDSGMLELLRYSREQLDEISVRMIGQMQRDGQPVSLDDYAAYQMPTGRGGWKGINYLLDRGLTQHLLEGMSWHGRYNAFYPEFRSLAQACAVIRQAGGVPVLAHPGNWWADNPPDLPNILRRLLDCGIGGVECYYPSHSPALRDTLLRFCHAHDLCITCGGDGHGCFNADVDGVHYDIGIMRVPMEKLSLIGIVQEECG